MKFKFDAKQDYQLKAIDSIVGLFENNKKYFSDAELLNYDGTIENRLTLTDEEILENLKAIQSQNKIDVQDELDGRNFSVEMETGTGKTYVYLRTIMELYVKYRFRKFIIIVPSVAIKEGVLKTLKITEDHFKDLYQGIMYRYYEYSSGNLTLIRQFAESNVVEIMVMTMASFNKDTNVINNKAEKLGDSVPMDYIRGTNPILILDEPQNMEGEATREALLKFNYSFTLRYSATHKRKYNLVYRLTPADAYKQGLVKKIEVVSVVREGDYSRAYIDCTDIVSKGNKLTAKIKAYSIDDSGVIKLKSFTLKDGDDLYKKTNLKYYEGFVTDEINYGEGYISFSNGRIVKKGEILQPDKKEIMKYQIEQAIIEHLKKKKKLNPRGIKVLTLFFIDRVDNYLESNGFIRKAFEEYFSKLIKQKDYSGLYNGVQVKDVHGGYFSKMKSESGMENDKEIYDTIMKDKERLLSMSEPLEFIFSHSALREGWDNPNVFNICTLNDTVSNMKKRQEIGRGVRLCVDDTGGRIFDTQINRLTVIANESYIDYVESLQNEYIDEYGFEEGSKMPRPENGNERVTVKVKDGYDGDPYFQELWERIKHKTKYIVNINTEDFVKRCVQKLNEIQVEDIKITAYKHEIENLPEDKVGIETKYLAEKRWDSNADTRIPNIISLIEEETKLTKKTIFKMLECMDDRTKIIKNPYDFVAKAVRKIKDLLIEEQVHSIQYVKVGDDFSKTIFKDIDTYNYRVIPVSNSIYEAVIYDDSNEELTFAKELDADSRVKLFIKLPNRFKIPTPVGNYIPDWAIVIETRDMDTDMIKNNVYFIAETKSTGDGEVDEKKLRGTEINKIDCARKNFSIYDGVRYDVVKTLQDVMKVAEY